MRRFLLFLIYNLQNNFIDALIKYKYIIVKLNNSESVLIRMAIKMRQQLSSIYEVNNRSKFLGCGLQLIGFEKKNLG